MTIELFSRLAPVDTPHGSVLLAHGLGEYQGRYGRFIDALTSVGYDVWSFDFTGHGTARGRRAHVDVRRLIREHLEARKALLQVARTDRIFLFGHSMGGLVTLASTLLDPHHLEAVAVTAPALRPLPSVHPLLAAAATAIGTRIPVPSSVSIDVSLISRDPQVVADYQADPMVYHGKVPLLTGATMVTQGNQVLKNARILAAPVLILHGEEDGLASVRGSQEFADRAGDLVEVVTIPGAYHELLNEPDHADYTRQILHWYGKW